MTFGLVDLTEPPSMGPVPRTGCKFFQTPCDTKYHEDSHRLKPNLVFQIKLSPEIQNLNCRITAGDGRRDVRHRASGHQEKCTKYFLHARSK